MGSLIGVAEGYDGFGTALVAGDFNHDGKDDLAIGVPDENFESAGADSAGLVQVLKGSSGGLTDTGNYALQLNDFAGVSLQTARMGFSLARGDFDHDGDDDLAVGAPFLAAGGAPEAGGVLVYRQISGSLTPALRYDQSSPNVTGTAESDDLCGFSLAAGDFDGDGQDDLSTGCPGETVTASGFAEGALVSVYFGIVSGAFTITQGQMWHKNSTGIPDQCSSSDYFTWSLTAGDFNGDGKADLAAGSIPTTATVNVIYGAP